MADIEREQHSKSDYEQLRADLQRARQEAHNLRAERDDLKQQLTKQ